MSLRPKQIWKVKLVCFDSTLKTVHYASITRYFKITETFETEEERMLIKSDI